MWVQSSQGLRSGFSMYMYSLLDKPSSFCVSDMIKNQWFCSQKAVNQTCIGSFYKKLCTRHDKEPMVLFTESCAPDMIKNQWFCSQKAIDLCLDHFVSDSVYPNLLSLQQRKRTPLELCACILVDHPSAFRVVKRKSINQVANF